MKDDKAGGEDRKKQRDEGKNQDNHGRSLALAAVQIGADCDRLKVASRAATLLFRTSLANRQPAPAPQTTKAPALGAFVSSAIEPVPSLLVTSAAASAAAAEVVAALHAGLVLIGRCMAGSSFLPLQAKRKAPTRGAFIRSLSKPGSYGLMICEACDPFGTIARQVGDADAAP